MKKSGNILLVDDNKGVLSALQLLLKPHFEETAALSSPAALPALLREREWQVVLLDMNFTAGINSGNEGLYWLRQIKSLSPRTAVVLFTAYADIGLAVRGIKEGAADFIVKPWDNNRLTETLLEVAGRQQSSKNSMKEKETAANERKMYWGVSQEMNRLRTLAAKVAATDANILITGENGTGKEMLAREIHACSSRSKREMVCVDMGAITETLFESELFGHAKGAFTDAYNDRPGKFEAAHGSTLFLDEIGNLPLHQQAKLLTVLQRRSIVRVGSNTPVPVDIRLVCATNRNLEEMVKQGTFREDLLYRINTINLEIPALRHHSEDILPLAERFVSRFCKQYDKPQMTLDEEAAQRLKLHSWPGNIRELEHAIEKAVIICDTPSLPADLFALPRKAMTSPAERVSTLEEMEVRMIRQALEQCKGNLSAVAVQLGITRQTLYNKMKKYGI
ncbi:MAG: sigma-54-dependent Fis family transcriptional regulator [Bacteroides sp.]|nr:sigma-54-dependent Fis family transcriptional regulator [Bacteroides sp.]